VQIMTTCFTFSSTCNQLWTAAVDMIPGEYGVWLG
jgi:hypothetical protein